VRAIVISHPGGPDVLELREVPRPEPGNDQILVRVAATAVNRADLSQRLGRYPPPPGWPEDIPGLEYAGTIEAVGTHVMLRSPGEHVMGLVGGGAYAEYITVNEDEAIPVPRSLALEKAAAVPEAFITAHDALLTQAALKPGETLLVHGAGSGVGTAATQIGHAIGARVLGTARSTWKLERAREYGLDVAIDSSRDNFADVVHRETGNRGADVILDLVGGDYLGPNVRALARHGRILIVGLVAGAKAELDMRALMSKRATIRGTVLRARSAREKAVVARAFAAFALPLLEAGHLRPVIDSIMPLEQAADAHRRAEANENFGKIVLTVRDAA
jgi:putative PIG3 family NAD(P)H quinone oxidoreductase